MVESTVLYDIDPDLYSLIANLRIIGNLKEGEKINTKGKIFIQPIDSKISMLSRTFYNTDNRENMMDFISITLKKAFKHAELYKKNRVLYLTLLDSIKFCDNGLKALVATYVNDINIKSRLETMIIVLKSFIEENCEETIVIPQQTAKERKTK